MSAQELVPAARCIVVLLIAVLVGIAAVCVFLGGEEGAGKVMLLIVAAIAVGALAGFWAS